MRSEKKYVVQSIAQMIDGSDYCYFVTYAGLKVKAFEQLRNDLAKQNASCHVLKNSLIRKAAAELKIDALDALDLTQSTAMVYGTGDCGAVAKLLAEFGKKNEQVKTKGGYLDDAYLSPADVTAIADLPSREVILAMLLGLIQAPARNLVSVINQGVAQVVNVTNAYKEKLEK